MNDNTIFVTGGSGRLGRLIVEKLLKTKARIILLIRAKSKKEAINRITKILKDDSQIGKKLIILNGDLLKNNFGLNSDDHAYLIGSTTHILNAAANTRFTLPLDEARKSNVETAQSIIDFAFQCSNLKRLGHLSTAYVAGKRTGRVLESELEHSKGFCNTYEQSKHEAELLMRSHINSLPIAIFRPSIVIESPKELRSLKAANALSIGLFLVRKGFLPLLPGREENKLDTVRNADAMQAIIELLLKDRLRYSTYHVTSADEALTLKDLFSLIQETSNQKIPIKFCGTMSSFTRALNKILRYRPDLNMFYRKTKSFLPELAYPKIFDNRNLLEETSVKIQKQRMIKEIRSILKQHKRIRK